MNSILENGVPPDVKPIPKSSPKISNNDFIEKWAMKEAKSGELPFYAAKNSSRMYSKHLWGNHFRVTYYDGVIYRPGRSMFCNVIINEAGQQEVKIIPEEAPKENNYWG
jgi:hypothetical protein